MVVRDKGANFLIGMLLFLFFYIKKPAGISRRFVFNMA